MICDTGGEARAADERQFCRVASQTRGIQPEVETDSRGQAAEGCEASSGRCIQALHDSEAFSCERAFRSNVGQTSRDPLFCQKAGILRWTRARGTDETTHAMARKPRVHPVSLLFRMLRVTWIAPEEGFWVCVWSVQAGFRVEQWTLRSHLRNDVWCALHRKPGIVQERRTHESQLRDSASGARA